MEQNKRTEDDTVEHLTPRNHQPKDDKKLKPNNNNENRKPTRRDHSSRKAASEEILCTIENWVFSSFALKLLCTIVEK
jgi:hypothetical protein